MNLMLHSITHPNVDYKDSLSKQNQISDAYTLCLAKICSAFINRPLCSRENHQQITERRLAAV